MHIRPGCWTCVGSRLVKICGRLLETLAALAGPELEVAPVGDVCIGRGASVLPRLAICANTGEPTGALPERKTGDLALPEENGERAVLAGDRGVILSAIDLLMAIALAVPSSVGGLPCMARQSLFMSALEVNHLYLGASRFSCEKVIGWRHSRIHERR